MTITSIGDINAYQSRMTYRKVEDNFVRSPKRVLEDGLRTRQLTSNCFEGALLFSHLLEHLGYEPRIMSLALRDAIRGRGLPSVHHAVALYETETGHGAISMSSVDGMRGVFEAPTLTALAAGFTPALFDRDRYVSWWCQLAMGDTVMNPDGQAIDWRTTDESLSFISRDFDGAERTRVTEMDNLQAWGSYLDIERKSA